MELKVSCVTGLGKLEVTDSGRYKEKKEDADMSNAGLVRIATKHHERGNLLF